MTSSVRNEAAAHRNGGIASLVRVVRAFAEASVVMLAFVFAILLVGLPIAMSVRAVHEGLSWLARRGGEMGAATEVLVSGASVVGGIIATAAFARVLVGLFRWNGRGPTLPAIG
jgi:hypothetical protein